MRYEDLDLSYDRVNIYPVNNNSILVATFNEDYMDSLRKHFSVKHPQARFMSNYKSGQWDGVIRFMKKNGLVPRGLLGEVQEKLMEWEIPFVLEGFDEGNLDISNFDAVIEKELLDKQAERMDPWEHQVDTAKALLEVRRGITRSATSAGKSYTISMMMWYLLKTYRVEKILMVVPRTDLVIQFQRDAQEYGIPSEDIGLFFGEIKDTEAPIIVATWQSLQNIKDDEFFRQFQCLMVDEVHGAGKGSNKSKKDREQSGTVMRNICDYCVNAEYRFGFTGSMPSEIIDKWTVIAGLGPVVNEIYAKELMEKGHVTPLKVIIPFIEYDKKVVNDKIKNYLIEDGIDEDTKKEDIPTTAKYNAERRFVENYIPRLKYIASIARSRLEKDENVLILANTIQFGDNLKKVLDHLLKDVATDVFCIQGDMKVMDRKDIREKMEQESGLVVIATTKLFSTGISVKRLHTAILGDIGKSETAVLQSIGRALRKHDTKEYARVYDLCDNLKYRAKHAKARMEFYAKEEFDVKIIELEL